MFTTLKKWLVVSLVAVKQEELNDCSDQMDHLSWMTGLDYSSLTKLDDLLLSYGPGSSEYLSGREWFSLFPVYQRLNHEINLIRGMGLLELVFLQLLFLVL